MTSNSSRHRSAASRRAILTAGAAIGGFLFAGSACRVLAEEGDANTIRLSVQGSERALPARFLGYNSPGPYIPYERPDFIPAVKALGPHVLRFPGGTVGNYYNWHLGHMVVPDAGAAGSVYREQLVQKTVPLSIKNHPNGVWVEDWWKIAQAVDANLVIMANLETSTPEDQAAWFADMAKKGVKADYVEMGTEFYLAMGDDMGRKVFPDPATANAITKRFLAAMRPHLPKDTKVAVQSSASAFELRKRVGKNEALFRGDNITDKRILEWDDALKPESWFDAVTMHLYPKEVAAAGMAMVKKLPASAPDVFAAMMARADSGFDRGIADVVARVPGKEIWLSEYGAFEPAQTFYGLDTHFNGLWLHQVTRELLVMARHPQVTVACYHALKCAGDLMSTFAVVDGHLKPINASSVQEWFFNASRGPGCSWQRVNVEGAREIAANGTLPGETYWDLEAGIFRNGSQRVLLVHNASAKPRRADLSRLISPQALVAVQTIATPDLLASLESGTPSPQTLAGGRTLDLPAYSITKIVWSA